MSLIDDWPWQMLCLPAHILWMDKILHHFETMGNHCLLVFAGELSFQGLLGGAGFCPSTVLSGMVRCLQNHVTKGDAGVQGSSHVFFKSLLGPGQGTLQGDRLCASFTAEQLRGSSTSRASTVGGCLETIANGFSSRKQCSRTERFPLSQQNHRGLYPPTWCPDVDQGSPNNNQQLPGLAYAAEKLHAE